jgi:hypothetical protein
VESINLEQDRDHWLHLLRWVMSFYISQIVSDFLIGWPKYRDLSTDIRTSSYKKRFLPDIREKMNGIHTFVMSFNTL